MTAECVGTAEGRRLSAEPKEKSCALGGLKLLDRVGGYTFTMKGRREKASPLHGALGCLAEGHSREADLPLLTLSEFSADLGSVLQQ